MKKIITLIAVFTFAATVAFAGKMVPATALPPKAQECIKTLYPNTQTQYVEQDFDGFDVLLANGVKIDFDNRGEWEEISNYAGLPDSLLPAPVLQAVKQAHPQALIVKIEKQWGGFEIKMNNAMELKVDQQGKIFSQKMDD